MHVRIQVTIHVAISNAYDRRCEFCDDELQNDDEVQDDEMCKTKPDALGQEEQLWTTYETYDNHVRVVEFFELLGDEEEEGRFIDRNWSMKSKEGDSD